MSKINEPPFKDEPAPNNSFWSLAWFEWLRDIWTRINERPALVGSGTENNFPKFNADADLVDSGKAVPSGDVVGTTDTQTLTNKTSDYYNLTNDPLIGNHAVRKAYLDGRFANEVTGLFITENLLPEAGTEHGSRFGSYRIGLRTEDDYTYFDEDGSITLYGSNFLRDITPVKDTGTTAKITVFDTDGYLYYRTLNEVAIDLSNDILASKDYVGERFITENLLDEAQVEYDNTTLVTSATYYIQDNDEAIYFVTDDNAITAHYPKGIDGEHFKLINAGSSGNDVTLTPYSGDEIASEGVDVTFALHDGEVLDSTFGNGAWW